MIARPRWSSGLVAFFGWLSLLLLFVGAAAALLGFLPRLYLGGDASPADLNAARQSIALIIVGGAAIITAIVGIKNLQLLRTAQLTQSGLDVSTQRGEQFAQYVTMLSSNDNVNLRMGAVYGLERLALTFPQEQRPVILMLGAFIRNRALEEGKVGSRQLPTDVGAAVAVVARSLSQVGECQTPNLTQANLSGAGLWDAWLPDAYLVETDLSDAEMVRANLDRARMQHARLVRTDLRGASLKGANLRDADLRGALLSGADFRDACLENARFDGAIVHESKNAFQNWGPCDLSVMALSADQLASLKLEP